jgi:hypothetical protein
VTAGLLVAIALLGLALAALWRRQQRLRRDEFIRNAPFPPGLLDRLGKRRPELALKDRVLVARGLRQFFLAYLHSGCRFVSMPSQAADDLWHEFILYTRDYDAFCARAFGRFLHHTPAVVLSADRKGNEGLRRTWWWCCKEENLNPRNPTRLPLLFALDAKLGVADGFHYSLSCRREGSDKADGSSASPYCAGDFADAAIDGGTDGFGDGGIGDGGADGGGNGGSCGGGCGGD